MKEPKERILEILGTDSLTAADFLERAAGVGLGRADAQEALEALVAGKVVHRSARGMHKVLTGLVPPTGDRAGRGAGLAVGLQDAGGSSTNWTDVRAVSVQGLRAFAEGLGRITIETPARHLQFEFWANDEGFHYVPASTDRQRNQAYKHVQNVVARYNEKRSLRPGDYPDLTVNGSYILAIIGRYVHDV